MKDILKIIDRNETNVFMNQLLFYLFKVNVMLDNTNITKSNLRFPVDCRDQR